MKKSIIVLAALAVCFISCEKAITIDHNISVEFPAQEALTGVSVSFGGGGADIVITDAGVSTSLVGLWTETLSDGGTLVRYKSLAVFCGEWTDLNDLLEETFWANPSLQWIFTGDFSAMEDEFTSKGFVNCLKARGLEASGTGIFAGSNTYDKITGLSAAPLSFTVMVKEEAQ